VKPGVVLHPPPQTASRRANTTPKNQGIFRCIGCTGCMIGLPVWNIYAVFSVGHRWRPLNPASGTPTPSVSHPRPKGQVMGLVGEGPYCLVLRE